MTKYSTDRAAGVLLAQACGDAIGVPYEFAGRLDADDVPQMSGGGLGPYEPGEWSDDTQMAICIARVAATGADLRSAAALDQIAEAFVEWAAHGASDIGVQTRAVLGAGVRGPGRPAPRLAEAAREYAARNARSAGNGALMRTSIVGLAAVDDRDGTAAAARAIAELTHADPLAGDSCVLWSEAVRTAVLDKRLDLAGGLDLVPVERRDQWSAWIDEATGAGPARFNPNGYTVTALQAAWAAITSTPVPELDPAAGSFPCLHLQHALPAAVRAGDDTDTVAAIAGGLLGAYWGASAVPARWRRAVHGWPGMRGRDLVALAALTAARGAADAQGWPTVEAMTNPMAHDFTASHPYDEGVFMGTVLSSAHDADAVVSLCRMGTAEPLLADIAPRDQVTVWLLDSEDPGANPNLDFVLADTADAVAELRAEGRRVLLHCVAAHQRTPSAAVAYARRLGIDAAEAQAAVRSAIPQARAHGVVWDAARGVSPR